MIIWVLKRLFYSLAERYWDYLLLISICRTSCFDDGRLLFPANYIAAVVENCAHIFANMLRLIILNSRKREQHKSLSQWNSIKMIEKTMRKILILSIYWPNFNFIYSFPAHFDEQTFQIKLTKRHSNFSLLQHCINSRVFIQVWTNSI